MGGAFVGVADDATAVYWNPAGVALGGAFLSLVHRLQPREGGTGGHQRGRPPVGGPHRPHRAAGGAVVLPADRHVRIAYDRPPDRSPLRLTTHHAGVTLVQSINEHVAVATTLKWVRGYAAPRPWSQKGIATIFWTAPAISPMGRPSKFDADIGMMARLGKVRAGLTVRNVTEPDFASANGQALTLTRQTRAGISYIGVAGLIVAADFDLERSAGSLGDVRECRGRRGGPPLQASDRPQRFPLQYARRRAWRPRAGVQPWRHRGDVSLDSWSMPRSRSGPAPATGDGASRRGSGTRVPREGQLK